MNVMQRTHCLNKSLNFVRWFSNGVTYRDPKNPQVFMKITKDGEPIGKMVFEVNLKSFIISFIAI